MKVKIISVFPVEIIDDEPKAIATILGVQVKYEYNNPDLILKDIPLENTTPEEIKEIEEKLKQSQLPTTYKGGGS